MRIGCVRVSTKEQNTARQEEIMKTLGVDKVYIDKMSGKDMERPALHEMMNYGISALQTISSLRIMNITVLRKTGCYRETIYKLYMYINQY